MHNYTVVTQLNQKGGQVLLYDEQDNVVVNLQDLDIYLLYSCGVFSEPFGSYRFKEQAKKYLTITA